MNCRRFVLKKKNTIIVILVFDKLPCAIIVSDCFGRHTWSNQISDMHQESEVGIDDANSWDSEAGNPFLSTSPQTPTKDDSSVLSTQTGSTGNNATESTVALGIVRSSSDKKRKKKSQNNNSPYSIQYKGVNIYQAAQQGSLPLCVLLWGMASAKRVNLLTPDSQGNNPLHAAALADSAEV